MASNPMQRKANMYLLIGVFVTLLITGSIIGILIMQHVKLKNEIDAEHQSMQTVYVTSKDIKSGDEVKTSDINTAVKVSKTAVPSNYITDVDSGDSETKNKKTIAKINIKAGSIVTSDMVYREDEEITADIRTQEFNTIVLPTQIEDGDTIDVRLRLPNGTDYIVISKKKVTIPTIDGVDSQNTIKMDVSEEEILLMSNAIVEAYWINGSKLYATTYKEPGNQDNATPTYLPNNEVATLISMDPNIIDVAKNALISRYNATSGTIRSDIVNSLNRNAEDSKDNIQTGVQDEINRAKQERQSYLEALGE